MRKLIQKGSFVLKKYILCKQLKKGANVNHKRSWLDKNVLFWTVCQDLLILILKKNLNYWFFNLLIQIQSSVLDFSNFFREISLKKKIFPKKILSLWPKKKWKNRFQQKISLKNSALEVRVQKSPSQKSNFCWNLNVFRQG